MSEELNEELLEEVKKAVPYVLAALVAVAGYYGIKHHLAERRAAASAALTEAYTVEEMEDAVARFGGGNAGKALKIRLAKKYYDSARYEEALSLYEELCGKTGAAFADIPEIGRAETLEAMGRTDEALAIYSAFAANNGGSYLALTANLGEVRCLARSDKAAALERLAALKESAGDDEAAKARIDALEDAVKRL